MSFMFRHKKKRTQGSASSFDRPTFTRPRGGGGQGQTMLQRQRPKAVTPQQQQQQQQNSTHHRVQQPKQQQGVSISMAEVMADLRILDEQQKESQRNLESARILKQRRTEQHGDLEAKLRQFKYQHGQNRAELQYIHQQLSQAQRLLGTDRLQASKAGDNLREFDRQLKKALTTKRKLTAHDRVGTAKMAQLRGMLTALERAKKQAKHDAAAAQQEVEHLEQHDADLRKSLRHKTADLQRNTQDTAQVRAENSRIEHELDGLLHNETTSQQEKANLQQQVTDVSQEKENLIQAAQKAAAQQTVILKELEPKIQQEKELVAGETTKLRILEQQIAQIQVDEKHVLPLPDGTPDPRTAKKFDEHLIRASEEAQAKALSEEEAAKDSLEKTMAVLRKQLEVVQAEESDAATKLQEISESFQGAKGNEDNRRIEYVAFINKLQDGKKLVETLKNSMVDHEKDIEKRIAELREESGALHMSIFNAKASVKESEEKLGVAEKEVQKTRDEYDSAKETDSAKLEKVQQKLASRQKKHEKLIVQVEKKKKQIDQAEQNEPKSVELELSLDEIKSEIAELYEEHPILLEANIVYAPEKTLKEQQEQDLRFLFAHCDQRERSAKKMRKELKAAAEREERERLKIEKAAAADKKRQREVREKRKKLQEKRDKGMDEGLISSDEEASRNTSEEAISAAKPRLLLDDFTQASQEGIAPGENEGVDNMLVSETKKVHWNDDRTHGILKVSKSNQSSTALAEREPKHMAFGRFGTNSKPNVSSKNAEFGIDESADKYKLAKGAKSKRSSSKSRTKGLASHRNKEESSTRRVNKEEKTSGRSTRSDRPSKSRREGSHSPNPRTSKPPYMELLDKGEVRPEKHRSASKSRKSSTEEGKHHLHLDSKRSSFSADASSRKRSSGSHRENRVAESSSPGKRDRHGNKDRQTDAKRSRTHRDEGATKKPFSSRKVSSSKERNRSNTDQVQPKNHREAYTEQSVTMKKSISSKDHRSKHQSSESIRSFKTASTGQSRKGRSSSKTDRESLKDPTSSRPRPYSSKPSKSNTSKVSSRLSKSSETRDMPKSTSKKKSTESNTSKEKTVSRTGKRKETNHRSSRASESVSMDRSNKSRRRKRVQSAGGAGNPKTKPTFDQDVSFNFLAD